MKQNMKCFIFPIQKVVILPPVFTFGSKKIREKLAKIFSFDKIARISLPSFRITMNLDP